MKIYKFLISGIGLILVIIGLIFSLFGIGILGLGIILVFLISEGVKTYIEIIKLEKKIEQLYKEMGANSNE